MLSGSSRRALPRGPARLRHSLHPRITVDLSAQHRLLGSQYRPYYGSFLKTVVEKHTASISDAIRPVLPFTPSNRSPTQPSTKAETRKNDARSPSRTTENGLILEDDTVTETPDVAVPETETQSHVRRLMRQVPHPVAIVTSTDPNSSEKTAFHGMTVSSFSTVTLYPKPVVSFNVKLPSETYNAIRSSSRFLVHLLGPNKVTAHLAREFSRGHENVLLDGENDKVFQFSSPARSKDQPSIRDGEPPRLKIKHDQNPTASGTPNFPFVFECSYLPQTCRVGDHVIVLGTVVNVLEDISPSLDKVEGHSRTADELCMTYADTRFWKMGEAIPPSSDL